MTKAARHRGELISAGALLGIGLGGFFDGILLHEILQWHHVLSSRIPPVDLASLEQNMVWDGLFHAGTWLVTALGIALLWRSGAQPSPRSTRTFAGSLALGWGSFNAVEGLINHQLLGLHHVHPGSHELAWDIGFLFSGLVLALAGWGLIRAGRTKDSPAAPLESSTSASGKERAAAH